MLKDTVICDDRQETRTHKVFHCLEQICYELDLGNPIWLDTTVRDFKKHSKTRFYQDNFIEQIDFDYLEITGNRGRWRRMMKKTKMFMLVLTSAVLALTPVTANAA